MSISVTSDSGCGIKIVAHSSKCPNARMSTMNRMSSNVSNVRKVYPNVPHPCPNVRHVSNCNHETRAARRLNVRIVTFGHVPMPERPAKCVSERHVDIVGYSIGPPHVKMLANAANESRCCHECGTTLSQMLRNIQTVPNVQMSEWLNVQTKKWRNIKAKWTNDKNT